MSKKSLPIFTLGSDYIFRSKNGMEADLIQPKDGEAYCMIVAEDADMDPTPYQTADDIRRVILREMAETGIRWFPEDVEKLVVYYQETWMDYTFRVSALNKQLSDISRRGAGLSFIEAISA